MEINDEECCQICLCPEAKLTMPCGHDACQGCLEKILLRTNPLYSYRRGGLDDSDEAIISFCPTRGKCPFCRSMVNMFDLKKVDVGCRSENIKQGLDANLDPDPILAYSTLDDFCNSPLGGASYRDREGKVTISFPTDGTEGLFMVRNEKKMYFDHDVNYHGKSKTFAGSIRYKKDDASSINLGTTEVIMQFSSDYRFVARGAIITQRSVVTDLRTYPFDGKWTIRWQRASDRDATFESLSSDQFRIVDNSWVLYGNSYRLIRCESSVQFVWDTGERQIVESGVDLESKPDGPDIGETIVWKVDDPDFYRIFWTRETKGDRHPPTIEPLGNSNIGIILLKQNCNPQNSRPTYNPNGLERNVFIQSHTVGLASYHFIAPQSDGDGNDSLAAYISYENSKCSSWPALDDGSPVPVRVPFVNCSYNCDAQTFRGTIPWHEAYGTTWMGCKAWNYEMHFDSEFVCILSGSVNSVTTGGPEEEMSKFGQDLIYVNAAIRQRIEQGALDDVVEVPGDNREFGDEESDADKIRKIINVRNEIKDRLLEEGATNKTLRQIFEASLGATADEEDPVDYNL